MVDCGLTNLASCLPEKFFEYLLSLISAPFQSLLDSAKFLLSEPVSLDVYAPLWAIVIYVISMFYAFLIIYSGINFMVSGYDVSKREKAKQGLRNVIIMILLVQASFFIYALINDTSAIISSSVLTLVPQDFFSLRIDSLSSFALQLTLGIIFLGTMVLTLLCLVLRYAIVAIGVMFFPIAIFAYFTTPLREYGLLAFNFLGTCMFITSLDSLIIVGFSKLIELPAFQEMKFIVMISALTLTNVLMLFLMFFSIAKSAFGVYTKLEGVVSKFI